MVIVFILSRYILHYLNFVLSSYTHRTNRLFWVYCLVAFFSTVYHVSPGYLNTSEGRYHVTLLLCTLPIRWLWLYVYATMTYISEDKFLHVLLSSGESIMHINTDSSQTDCVHLLFPVPAIGVAFGSSFLYLSSFS